MTPSFDVTAYGAKADGTSDDGRAIQRATDACAAAGGGTVYFPPGTYYLSSTNEITLPHGNTGWVVLSGYGATMRLSDECQVFVRFDATGLASDLTWKKFVIEGFTVDASNSTAASSSRGTLIDTWDANHSSDFLDENIEDVTVRDCTVVNLTGTAAANRWGVGLLVHQSVENRATQNWVKRVDIDNVRIEGGYTGIAVAALHHISRVDDAYNLYMEDITIEGCYHDTGSVPTATGGGSNFIIGNAAWGDRWIIRDCIGKGSTDVGVEVDAGVNTLVENVDIWNAVNPFYHTNYNTHADFDVAKSRTVFSNCRVHNTSASIPAVASGFKAVDFKTVGAGQHKLGHLEFVGCSVDTVKPGENGITLSYAGTGASTCSPSSVTVRDFNYDSSGWTWTTGTAYHAPLEFYEIRGKPKVVIDSARIAISGARSSGTLYTWPIYLTGAAYIDWRYVDIDVSVAGASAWSTAGLRLGSMGGTVLGGTISNLRIVRLGHDTSPSQLWVGSTGQVSFDPGLVVRDSTFLSTGAAFDIPDAFRPCISFQNCVNPPPGT